MRFSTREERDSLIAGFQTKADSLTSDLLKKNEIPKGTKIIFETATDWDTEISQEKMSLAVRGLIDLSEFIPDDKIEYEEDGKTVKSISNPGDILVMYIRQPQLINAAQILDRLRRGGQSEAGLFAWDSMVLSQHSSPEIEEYERKLGFATRLGNTILIKAPDYKKK